MNCISKLKEKSSIIAGKTMCRVNEIVKSERGDTNFISIIIVLGIVLTIALIFIGFKDQIVTAAQAQIEKFLSAFS